MIAGYPINEHSVLKHVQQECKPADGVRGSERVMHDHEQSFERRSVFVI